MGWLALGLWSGVLSSKAAASRTLPLETLLVDVGALLAIAGILIGGLLDFLALRKTQMS